MGGRRGRSSDEIFLERFWLDCSASNTHTPTIIIIITPVLTKAINLDNSKGSYAHPQSISRSQKTRTLFLDFLVYEFFRIVGRTVTSTLTVAETLTFGFVPSCILTFFELWPLLQHFHFLKSSAVNLISGTLITISWTLIVSFLSQFFYLLPGTFLSFFWKSIFPCLHLSIFTLSFLIRTISWMFPILTHCYLKRFECLLFPEYFIFLEHLQYTELMFRIH